MNTYRIDDPRIDKNSLPCSMCSGYGTTIDKFDRAVTCSACDGTGARVVELKKAAEVDGACG